MKISSALAWLGRRLHPRLPMRRSTAVMVVLFAGFAYLYSNRPVRYQLPYTVPTTTAVSPSTTRPGSQRGLSPSTSSTTTTTTRRHPATTTTTTSSTSTTSTTSSTSTTTTTTTAPTSTSTTTGVGTFGGTTTTPSTTSATRR